MIDKHHSKKAICKIQEIEITDERLGKNVKGHFTRISHIDVKSLTMMYYQLHYIL
jgi:hypothetical protein